MRSLSLISVCGFLLVATACGSTTSEPSGEVRGQADVQRLFQSIMPDLVAAFTELAKDSSLAPSTVSSGVAKGGGNSSTVNCPGGGTLTVDLVTGSATLTDCAASGVTISASLFLFVSTFDAPSYQAQFSGNLMVSGSFNGNIQVLSANIQWTDPATDENTFWDVQVQIEDKIYFASGGGSGNGSMCAQYDPPGGPGSVPPSGPCDDDGDCQSDSCRDPIENPSEGCTCRNLNSTDCSSCIGVNAAPPGAPSNTAVECAEGVDPFSCDCLTESGETLPFYPSASECFY
jgi:hypothetical protein